MNIESETKLQVSAGDFKALLARARVEHFSDQLNIYYDFNKVLFERGATLRIRLSSDAPPRMTLKIPLHSRGMTRKMIEMDSRVPRRFFARVYPSIIWPITHLPVRLRRHLHSLKIREVQRVGWLRNRRWKVSLHDLSFELDHLKLPDRSEFYEVEMESDEPRAHWAFHKLIRNTAPSAAPSRLSKYQRFICALENSSQDISHSASLINEPI